MTRTGSVFGEFFEWYNSSTSVSISKVFFENSFNPTKGVLGSKYMPSISYILGFPCQNLYTQIISDFDQTNIWGGYRLRSEFDFQFGANFCTPTSTCPYNVTNCVNCPQSATQVDLNLFNVACQFNTNQWVWVYTAKNNGTIVNNDQIVINGTTFFDGNFNQSSNASLVFDVNNPNNTLSVSGCVSIQGNITVVLDQIPTQAPSSYNLINYSCDQKADLSNSQVQIQSNTKQKNCEKLTSQTVDSGNSISVSISFSNKDCSLSRSTVLGLAIGLGLGIPLLLGVGFAFIIFYLRRRQSKNASHHVKKYEEEMTNYQSTNTTNTNDKDL